MSEGVGIITEIIGINNLKLCNSFKYDQNDLWVDESTRFKFAEIKFTDKNNEEKSLEFFHYPTNGNWNVYCDRKEIANAVSWPYTWDKSTVPETAALFLTDFFGYKFIVADNLKISGAKMKAKLANGLSNVLDLTSRAPHYIDSKKQMYKDKWADEIKSYSEHERQATERSKNNATISRIASIISGNKK